MSEDQDQPQSFPSFVDLCFKHPLYEVLEFTSEEGIKTYPSYLHYKGRHDDHCAFCNDRTIFSLGQSVYEKQKIAPYEEFNPRTFEVKFSCQRRGHIARFHFLFDGDNRLQKIGQHPSLADTAIAELQRYRKILQAETSSEFQKAIGLAAHDVGIGAFVYLRRVLENIIESRKNEAISSGDLNDVDFESLRISEKIAHLKGHLPDTLVDNKKIYSVLSKGVHELSEQECLQYFPILRDLMFVILEEDMENVRKREHLQAAISGLEKIK